MSDLVPTFRQTRRAGFLQLGLLRDWSQHEIDLPVPGLPDELDGLRILHLSDSHFGSRWVDGYDRLLAAIEALGVDLIAFTGDWVEDKFDYRVGLPAAQRFARGLRSKFGTFGCLGNHDGDLIAPHLADAGVHLLVGESRRILGSAASIEVIGLPGVERDDASPVLIKSFGRPAAGSFRLVLTHFPDHIRRLGPAAPHLVLAGHTHGGQVCLPGGRAILTHDSLPRRQTVGLHRIGDAWLHTSRGIGCSQHDVRLFCPPEITVVKMQKSE